MAKELGKKSYLNTNYIDWPPTRQSLKLLCKALNIQVSENKILDAMICCRGPKLENEPEENFDEDKLVLWFQINLKMLKHINYEEADPDWIAQNPHV